MGARERIAHVLISDGTDIMGSGKMVQATRELRCDQELGTGQTLFMMDQALLLSTYLSGLESHRPPPQLTLLRK